MAQKTTQWIHKKAARIIFRMLFDWIDFAEIEMTEHFRDMQLERGITLADVHNVYENGFVKKEYKPDSDHSSWRWALYYNGITLIFTLNLEEKRIVFITCWKGKEPKEGTR